MNSTQLSLRQRDQKLIENWYVICLESEIKSKSALRRTIYDTPLVIFKSESGKIGVLSDVCSHRAAQLSKGKVCGETITCPYHGWKYDLHGQCTQVPSEGPNPDTIDTHLKVRSYPCATQSGLIWVWMGLNPPPPGPPPFTIPEWDQKEYTSYYMITDFNNEVTALAENFMDVPHTIFVHKGWFRSPSQKKVPIQIEAKNRSVLVTYQQENDQIGFFDRILNPRREKMLHTDRFIMPNITRVDYHFGNSKHYVISSQITPVSTLKSRVYTYIGYRMGFVLASLKPLMHWYTRQVINQDVDIMENQAVNRLIDIEPPQKNTSVDLPHLYLQQLRSLGKNPSIDLDAYEKLSNQEMWI